MIYYNEVVEVLKILEKGNQLSARVCSDFDLKEFVIIENSLWHIFFSILRFLLINKKINK